MSIVVEIRGLLLSAYFDDFRSMSQDELVSSAAWTIETFLFLLGLKFARDAKRVAKLREDLQDVFLSSASELLH